MKFPSSAPVAELLLLVMSSSKKKKKKSHHDSDSRLCHQLKKINKNQPGFFPLYTQKAGPAAIKEIRGENLAHFLFVKQLCWSRFKEIKDLYSPLV